MNTPSPAEEQAAAPLSAGMWFVEDRDGAVARLQRELPASVIHEVGKTSWIFGGLAWSYSEVLTKAHNAAVSVLNARIAELEGQVAVLRTAAENYMAYAEGEYGVGKGSADQDDHNVYGLRIALDNLATSAQAHLAELRNAALEEAIAAVKKIEGSFSSDPTQTTFLAGAACRTCISALRALKSTQEPTQS